jgi:hypothetical protein
MTADQADWGGCWRAAVWSCSAGVVFFGEAGMFQGLKGLKRIWICL